ncbi:DNA polymerase III subunit delta [Isosphaeraceae bacterium EP7]
MLALELLRSPTKAGKKPVFALFGDDPYLRHEALHAIVRSTLGDQADDMAVSRFAGESAGLSDVLDELRTLPFLSKCRVVVVDNADPFITAHRKELEAYADRPSSSGVLILMAKLWNGSTRLAKIVEKIGLAVDCKTPDERGLIGWMLQHAKEQSVRLDEEAARLLLELVGPEPGILATEVDKLAVYVGDVAAIRVEDVARMVGAGRVETIWKVLDAATTGAMGPALADMDRLIASGEHPVGLLAAMSASLRKLHHAGQLRRQRVDLKDACQRAGMPPYPKMIEQAQRQHSHLGPARVDRLPGQLLEVDLNLKGSSQLAPRTIIERLIVELARRRED